MASHGHHWRRARGQEYAGIVGTTQSAGKEENQKALRSKPSDFHRGLILSRRHSLRDESRPPDDGYDKEKYVCFEAHEGEISCVLLSDRRGRFIMPSIRNYTACRRYNHPNDVLYSLQAG